ncbi:MAG: sulfotransferase [Oceanicaulis sp.]
MTQRLFVIGMNKTGTRSLHQLFKRSGYNAVHWDGGALARTIDENIHAGRDPIAGYERYEVFLDMEGTYGQPVTEAYRYFKEIYTAHPQALFLLNYRDVDDWLYSKRLHGVKRHGYQIYLDYYKQHIRARSDEEVVRHWRRSYYEHTSNVLAFFENKPDSLVLFNLDRDTPEDLAERLRPQFNIDPQHWAHVGRTTWRASGDRA